jgi:16S rRNA (uracil1498-N3)-methyltransferase
MPTSHSRRHRCAIIENVIVVENTVIVIVVAIAACEQCGRNRVPQVLPVLPLAQFCTGSAAEGTRLLLSPLAGLGLRAAKLDGAVALAAGPEAGFTAEEEALLAEAGFLPVRLGPRVLRTETAALAALAALNALAGDF